jgi:hypothetical protein
MVRSRPNCRDLPKSPALRYCRSWQLQQTWWKWRLWSKRIFCRPCVDWSERRYHIAGHVGAEILRRFTELAWLKRDSDTRAVRVTVSGQVGFWHEFGMDFRAAVSRRPTSVGLSCWVTRGTETCEPNARPVAALTQPSIPLTFWAQSPPEQPFCIAHKHLLPHVCVGQPVGEVVG